LARRGGGGTPESESVDGGGGGGVDSASRGVTGHWHCQCQCQWHGSSRPLISTMLRVAALCFSVAAAHKHAGYGPLNPLLGTHGYPSCVAGPQGMCVEMTDQCLEKNQMTMACHQNKGLEGALRIGAIGDSITAGACSSGGDHPYPQQLQLMLNASQYTVTNLGACGSTMQKGADSPYWKRPQFTTLTQNKWDVIIIMLGTNDAKDSIDGGPSNWVCGTDLTNITVENCRFAQDCKCFLFFVLRGRLCCCIFACAHFAYCPLSVRPPLNTLLCASLSVRPPLPSLLCNADLAMIELVRTLGTTAGVPPTIYVAMPPPLMQHGSIGANQTVINTVYPVLIPMIAQAANLTTVPISVFAGMGGVPNWEAPSSGFPSSCTLNSNWPACAWWCDAQHCDQCQ
jgi:hypothetical protein